MLTTVTLRELPSLAADELADLAHVNSYALRAQALTEWLLDQELAELDANGQLRATPRGRMLGGALDTVGELVPV
jgi:hypothetical protein